MKNEKGPLIEREEAENTGKFITVDFKVLKRKFIDALYRFKIFLFRIGRSDVIKLPVRSKPLAIPSNNSWPYAVLSELYGLKEKDQTIDLDQLIDLAEARGHINQMSINVTNLKSFNENIVDKEFITINYMKECSSMYDPKMLFDKFTVNEVMVLHPREILWIYHDTNLSNNMEFYRIKIRNNIKNNNKVVLGEDIIIEKMSATNSQLTSLIGFNPAIKKILTGIDDEKMTIYNAVNVYHDPDSSQFTSIEEDLDEEELEESDDSEELEESDDKETQDLGTPEPYYVPKPSCDSDDVEDSQQNEEADQEDDSPINKNKD